MAISIPSIDYSKPRYWYHISTTLCDASLRVIPWDERQAKNRSDAEPTGKRFCVAPSIEQCLVAVPEELGEFSVYRTLKKVRAVKASGKIFDKHITSESWITKPVDIIRVGGIFRTGEGIERYYDAAGWCNASVSRSVLRCMIEDNFIRHVKWAEGVDPKEGAFTHVFRGRFRFIKTEETRGRFSLNST